VDAQPPGQPRSCRLVDTPRCRPPQAVAQRAPVGGDNTARGRGFLCVRQARRRSWRESSVCAARERGGSIGGVAGQHSPERRIASKDPPEWKHRPDADARRALRKVPEDVNPAAPVLLDAPYAVSLRMPRTRDREARMPELARKEPRVVRARTFIERLWRGLRPPPLLVCRRPGRRAWPGPGQGGASRRTSVAGRHPR